MKNHTIDKNIAASKVYPV